MKYIPEFVLLFTWAIIAFLVMRCNIVQVENNTEPTLYQNSPMVQDSIIDTIPIYNIDTVVIVDTIRVNDTIVQYVRVK
jgi:hypothetical protein